jgi:hypothetical protein
MSKLGGLAMGAWEFVVGEDWRTALGVVVAIALTALIAEVSAAAAWLVMAVAVLLLLAMSVWRSVRGAFHGHDT